MLCDKISIGFLSQYSQIILIAKHPVLLLRAIRKHPGDASNKKGKTKQKGIAINYQNHVTQINTLRLKL